MDGAHTKLVLVLVLVWSGSASYAIPAWTGGW